MLLVYSLKIIILKLQKMSLYLVEHLIESQHLKKTVNLKNIFKKYQYINIHFKIFIT